MAQRETRRAQRGAADIKATQFAAETVPTTEIDLTKVDLPGDVIAAVEGETDLAAVKRRPVRLRKAAVKAE
jgi:small subunit ribosomal protein S2